MSLPASSPSVPIRNKCSTPLVKDDPRTRQQKRQPRICSRNVLIDINGIGSSCSTTTSSTASSSLSFEARLGCHSVFNSKNSSSNSTRTDVHDRPKGAFLRTPKSAPNARPSKITRSRTTKENLSTFQIVEKSKKNSPFIYQSQSRRKKSCHGSQKSKASPNLNSGAQLNPVSVSFLNFVADKTPEEHPNLIDPKTPPVETSLSPELHQRTSSMLSPSPVCYGASHILSGISDGRKCKPRGVLTVAESGLGFDKSARSMNEGDLSDASRASPVPFPPLEASVHWHLSPCSEESEYQKNSRASPSPSSCAVYSEGSGDVVSLIFPSKLHGVLGHQSNFLAPSSFPPHSTPICKAEETSPDSIHFLGSEYFIETPQSHPSSNRRFGLSGIEDVNDVGCEFQNELDSVASVLERTDLSLSDSLDVTLQYDEAVTFSNSLDHSKFQNIGDAKGSRMDSSSLENASHEPHESISWREGLASQSFDMEEFDICRCLSDEDTDFIPRAADYETLVYKIGSPELVSDEPGLNRKCEEKFLSHLDNSESMCMDGGSLVASGDSDFEFEFMRQK